MIQLQATPLSVPLHVDFNKIFKREIESLPLDQLPLQQGLQLSSAVSEDPISLMVLNVTDHASSIEVKAGIFYSGIIAGCNCSDDPTPPDTQQEHCEILFMIERPSGKVQMTLL